MTPALIALSAMLSGPAHAAGGGWSLAAVYDAAALARLEPDIMPSYKWLGAEGMNDSCGPAKFADGIGVADVESMANGMTPALAILLERGEGASEGALRPETVRISIGQDDKRVYLQPAVMPRYAAVQIKGGRPEYAQLVRTQLEMELCMEHKTGRGWVGGKGPDLRQAFLLDPPATGYRARKYFGGQKEPVPALLGPPDACIGPVDAENQAVIAGGRGESSLNLVPADVWGASLRTCGMSEEAGDEVLQVGPPVQLRLSAGEEGPPVPAGECARCWRDLRVELGNQLAETEVTFDLFWGEEQIYDNRNLFEPVPSEDPKKPVQNGLVDILAQIPHSYPSVGPPQDPDRYTLLMVPNWQVVEALARLGLDHPDDAMPSDGEGVRDGVGWVLANPGLLFVQVPPSGGAADADWLDLGASMSGGELGEKDWGYTVGLLSGRRPVALPAVAEPTWTQARVAQRSQQNAIFMASAFLVALFSFAGLRRIRDFWARIPEERAAYWPGAALADDAPPSASEAQGMGGE